MSFLANKLKQYISELVSAHATHDGLAQILQIVADDLQELLDADAHCSTMIRTVIESPFGRTPDGRQCTPEEYAANVLYLRRCIRDSLARGEAPYASHGFFPGALDDTDPAQRKLGIEAGLAWGRAAQRVAVYVDRGITEGMRTGIARHTGNGLEIVYREIGA